MTAESIELVAGRFLEHNRALGRKYLSEEHELRLLVRFADARGIIRLDRLTPGVLDDFLGSRSRSRPRSFNHLLGVVGCLLEWAVSQQLLTVSPLKTRRRRTTANRIPFLFDQAQARRLLDAAGALADNSRAPRRARLIGRSSGSATGSGSVPARRADCGSATSTPPATCSSSKAGSSARAASFHTDQGSRPCSPSNSNDVQRTARPAVMSRCSPSTASEPCTHAPPARRSTSSSSGWSCQCPTESGHRRCTASVTASPSAACCAGTARGWTRPPDCTGSRRSWGTSIRPQPRST